MTIPILIGLCTFLLLAVVGLILLLLFQRRDWLGRIKYLERRERCLIDRFLWTKTDASPLHRETLNHPFVDDDLSVVTTDEQPDNKPPKGPPIPFNLRRAPGIRGRWREQDARKTREQAEELPKVGADAKKHVDGSPTDEVVTSADLQDFAERTRASLEASDGANQ